MKSKISILISIIICLSISICFADKNYHKIEYVTTNNGKIYSVNVDDVYLPATSDPSILFWMKVEDPDNNEIAIMHIYINCVTKMYRSEEGAILTMDTHVIKSEQNIPSEWCKVLSNTPIDYVVRYLLDKHT